MVPPSPIRFCTDSRARNKNACFASLALALPTLKAAIIGTFNRSKTSANTLMVTLMVVTGMRMTSQPRLQPTEQHDGAALMAGLWDFP